MCMHVSVSVVMQCSQRPKEGIGSLALQRVVSYHVSAELKSARAASALNKKFLAYFYEFYRFGVLILCQIYIWQYCILPYGISSFCLWCCLHWTLFLLWSMGRAAGDWIQIFAYGWQMLYHWAASSTLIFIFDVCLFCGSCNWKSRALCMLDKHPITELHLQAYLWCFWKYKSSN